MSDNTGFANVNPIDAVILWVDGSDPILAEKRNYYLGLEKKTVAHPELFRHVSHHQTK